MRNSRNYGIIRVIGLSILKINKQIPKDEYLTNKRN